MYKSPGLTTIQIQIWMPLSKSHSLFTVPLMDFSILLTLLLLKLWWFENSCVYYDHKQSLPGSKDHISFSCGNDKLCDLNTHIDINNSKQLVFKIIVNLNSFFFKEDSNFCITIKSFLRAKYKCIITQHICLLLVL